MQKELLTCLPSSDVKNTKKYTFLCELSCVFKHMISLFLTTSYVLLRIRQTINSVEDVEVNFDDLRKESHSWGTVFVHSFNQDYLIDFILPVTSLCLTLLSIMVELQQVINMCLDMDEDDSPTNNQKH